MQQRLYLDTSVFGGYFDEEFQEFTIPLFKRIKSCEFQILFSSITQDEVSSAPDMVQNLIKDLPINCVEYITLTPEATTLASLYISEKVVGKTSFADCLHISLATIYQADLLISWNFKHIVNVQKIRGYNSVNLKSGYRILEIRSPRELLNYENEV
jgi:hypothetical protein